MSSQRAFLVLAAALIAAGAWLGVAHAGGKSGVKPQKGVQHAFVTAGGPLLAGYHSKDVLDALPNGTGSYIVHLKGGASTCTITANIRSGTIGSATTSTNLNFGLNAVEVDTWDKNGASVNQALYVMVAC
jgi:hypothetical protein